MRCWNCYYIHFQNRHQQFKYLSQKLATLLVLLCGQRCTEILSVLDIRNLDVSENICVIRIGDILKTSGPKHHISEIKFHAYPNDLTMCPLNCLRQYLQVTKQHRGCITSLFITMNKPFKVPSKDILVRWVKQTLKDINMNIFSTHSTRSASNSKAKTQYHLKPSLKQGVEKQLDIRKVSDPAFFLK